MTGPAGDNLQVRLIGDPETWRGMRREWNDLADRTPSASFYSRWEWQHAWWRELGAGYDLSIVAVSGGDGRLRAVFPFCVRRQRTGPFEQAVASLLGHGHCDQMDILAPQREPKCLEAAIGAMEKAHGRLVFEFGAVRRESLVNLEFCRGMARGRESKVKAPYLSLPRDQDEMWWLISARARRCFSRGLRIMKTSGESEMLVTRAPSGVRECSDVIFGLQKQRFSDRLADAGSFDRYRAFIGRALEDSAGEGAAVASAWKLGGEAAAAQICVDHGGKRYFLLSGFDQKHSKIRPGICLHVSNIIDAVEAGLTEYDFMAGGEEYKYMFTNTDRELVTFAAGKRPVLLSCYLAIEKMSAAKRMLLAKRD
jgi:CelD/BcsL family acetyltransferase involved in cellulose biosynthesis